MPLDLPNHFFVSHVEVCMWFVESVINYVVGRGRGRGRGNRGRGRGFRSNGPIQAAA